MFHRLVFEESAAIFTIVAFLTAATIFLFFTWRAVRMSRAQEDRFAQLPFNSDSAKSPDDHAA